MWKRGSWEGEYVGDGGGMKVCGGGEDGGRVRVWWKGYVH